MIKKILVVCLLLAVITAYPLAPAANNEDVKLDIQAGRPSDIHVDGKLIPLQNQVPGPRPPSKQRREVVPNPIPDNSRVLNPQPKKIAPEFLASLAL